MRRSHPLLVLITLLLTSGIVTGTAIGEERWGYKGWDQEHPQRGRSSLSEIGTQCYFCDGEKQPEPGDGDRDGILDNADACPETPYGHIVDERGCSRDSDGDGVLDHMDNCPETTPNTPVDAVGCALPQDGDSDGDGVMNSRDRCPTTPPNSKVNRWGCRMDSDEDGIDDYTDQCPGTPIGFIVDSVGCRLDSDEDGVFDHLDKCPGTPPQSMVDENGCRMDDDNDGVYNHLDQCPETPNGATVNIKGCWVLADLYFDTNKATVRHIGIKTLNEVTAVLQANPRLRIEIQGHTDHVGTNIFNMDLSQRRAQTVRSYLIKRGIAAHRMQARGYGEEQPIADNATIKGRAMNRRVQLNPIR
ncbi:MAG: OmpA family protein [Magnetococcales bacterium]|nr:OmpA family protein [Magnetococcales bacterium]